MSQNTEKLTSLRVIQKFAELTEGPRSNRGAGEPPTAHPRGLTPIPQSHLRKVDSNVLKMSITNGRNPEHRRLLPSSFYCIYVTGWQWPKLGDAAAPQSGGSSSNMSNSFVGGTQFEHSPSYAGHTVSSPPWDFSEFRQTNTGTESSKRGKSNFLPMKFCFPLSSNDTNILMLLGKKS